MTRQATDWEIILVNHIANKGLASTINKELSKLKKTKQNLKNGHLASSEEHVILDLRVDSSSLGMGLEIT